MRRFLSDQELGESYRLTLIDEVSTLSLEESRMKRLVSALTVLTVILSFTAARAADGPPVTPFEADGVVADVLELFPCAIKDNKKADRARAQTTLKEVAARALVTKDGVYAFLETPENKRALKGVKPGTAVSIKGRLLAAGALLHIDSLSKPKGDPGVDLRGMKRRTAKRSPSGALTSASAASTSPTFPTLAHWATSIIWRPTTARSTTTSSMATARRRSWVTGPTSRTWSSRRGCSPANSCWSTRGKLMP